MRRYSEFPAFPSTFNLQHSEFRFQLQLRFQIQFGISSELYKNPVGVGLTLGRHMCHASVTWDKRKQSPLFCFSDGQLLTQDQFVQELLVALSAQQFLRYEFLKVIGFYSYFSSHSSSSLHQMMNALTNILLVH